MGLNISSMVSQNALSKVFRIKSEQGAATCFVIEHKGKEYLVTARHVIEWFSESQPIEIFRENIWVPVNAALVGHSNDLIDVSVLALDRQMSPQEHLPLPVEDFNVFFGQEVYFLGFPYGLFADVGQTNYGYPIPFIKKAIISSLQTDKTKPRKYYLDGHNNDGFSGGPVLVCSPNKTNFKVAAIVSGYVPNNEMVFDVGRPTTLSYRDNTGIIIAYGMRHAVELIEANPIGFQLYA